MREKLHFHKEPSITLQTTLMKRNVYELPKIIDFASELGVDRVKAFHLFSHSKEMDLECVDPIEYDKIHKKAIQTAKKSKIKVEIAEPFQKSHHINLNRRYCPLLWIETFIDVDEKVYPCHSHSGDTAGNVNQYPFFTIWNSQFYQNLRLKMHEGNPIWNCKGCGMLFDKLERNQPVPYDLSNFRSQPTYNYDGIRWSSRMKQFDNIRKKTKNKK